MARDIPIIFSAPMVRALLDSRKTQTRRVLKKPAALNALSVFGAPFLLLPGNADLIRYAVGDRLWVREAWAKVPRPHPAACGFENTQGCAGIIGPDGVSGATWREHWPDGSRNYGPWKPSIHMPRWASRLTLVVEGVKVERLNDINQEGAQAAGMVECPELNGWSAVPEDRTLCGSTARGAFYLLWNHLHGADAWDANPTVVALTFRVVSANIDAPVAEAAHA